jgi:tRNA(fMet)-specific endonuclease VapC
MGKKSVVLCDTNIIIELYKGNSRIVKELQKIEQQNIAISIITAGELLYGALNKNELRKITQDIQHLHTFNIDSDISDTFLKLMNSYSLSHKLSLPDAFIAATAIFYDIELFTLNVKDFKFIKGLKLFK